MMNGHDAGGALMQAAITAQQQIEGNITAFLQAMTNQLSPGYQGCVIFLNPAQPQATIFVSAAKPTDIFNVLVHGMRMNHIPIPEVEPANGYADEDDDDDYANKIVDLCAAMRKAMMYITGPGAGMAKAILGNALTKDDAADTARRIVAGYLSTVPGMTNTEPEHIESRLKAADDGASVLLVREGRNSGRDVTMHWLSRQPAFRNASLAQINAVLDGVECGMGLAVFEDTAGQEIAAATKAAGA